MRLKIEPVIRRGSVASDAAHANLSLPKLSHEVVDEIYKETRKAVGREVDLIDSLFLVEAVNEGKAAHELELTNLLQEKEKAEKQLQA